MNDITACIRCFLLTAPGATVPQAVSSIPAALLAPVREFCNQTLVSLTVPNNPIPRFAELGLRNKASRSPLLEA